MSCIIENFPRQEKYPDFLMLIKFSVALLRLGLLSSTIIALPCLNYHLDVRVFQILLLFPGEYC